MTTRSRGVRAALAVLGAATVAAVVTAPAVGAHVSVNPGEAEKGGFTRLAFRVPNERDDASTTRVQVTLPAEEHPTMSHVSVQPVPGWDYEVETVEVDAAEAGEEDAEGPVEIVSSITWTGGEIRPGEFQEFVVSAGRLPEDVDSLAFPTIQNYEGGEEVRWIEVSDDPEAELERPAPVLTLVAPAEEGEAGASGDGGDGEAAGDAAGVSVENVADQGDVDSAGRLGLLGILAGVVGIAVGAVALLRGRGSPAGGG